MSIANSSRCVRRPPSRTWLLAASCALLVTWCATPAFARFSEENLPAQDMPSGTATPDNGPDADWVQVPSGSNAGAAAAPAAVASPAGNPGGDSTPADSAAAPVPMASPTDIAPLEVGSVAPELQISDGSLEELIRKTSTAQPALAASLRVTDQARDEILNHHEDDAIQTLQRAISIDGSNPYAFFYVGRAYLAKKNYDQAITFFKRAENRLGTSPQWLAETLAFEGLANEESGQAAAAIACYQKTLLAVPGNLMARVGLTRLGGGLSAPAVQPVAATDNGATAAPAPDGSTIPPPPNAPPPPASN